MLRKIINFLNPLKKRFRLAFVVYVLRIVWQILHDSMGRNHVVRKKLLVLFTPQRRGKNSYLQKSKASCAKDYDYKQGGYLNYMLKRGNKRMAIFVEPVDMISRNVPNPNPKPNNEKIIP